MKSKKNNFRNAPVNIQQDAAIISALAEKMMGNGVKSTPIKKETKKGGKR